jgi:L-lactate dehydrogenase complex protein LldG
MSGLEQLYDTFTRKAELVSAVVSRVDSTETAFRYAVDICDRKEACQLLVSGCAEPLSPPADDLCETKAARKVMAAPGLPADQLSALKSLCDEKEIALIDDGLRDHLAGIDIGFTVADFGIAETGSLVLDSSSEAIRLATMISEIHIALLPMSKIFETAYDLEDRLQDLMAAVPNYTAFITGASRTADIERVLALGVHGPLELHILLWEDI